MLQRVSLPRCYGSAGENIGTGIGAVGGLLLALSGVKEGEVSANTSRCLTLSQQSSSITFEQVKAWHVSGR